MGSTSDRGRGARAQGGTSGPDAGEDAVEAPDAAPEAVEGTDAPESAPEATEPAVAVPDSPAALADAGTAPKRRYRAMTAMGEGDDAVIAGEIFEAGPDDVRVKSRMVTPLKDATPAPVAEAFDGVGQAPS